jgi:hypothetical protein
MKTKEELLKEVLANEKLKAEAVKAVKADKLADFLKAHDCSDSVDEVIAFVKAKAEKAGIPLSLLEML